MQRDFHFSKIRIFLLLAFMAALAVIFTFVFINLLSSPEKDTAGLLISGGLDLLFIWCVYFLGKVFFQKEANVTISDDGLTLRGTAGPGFIPWEDIEGVLPYEVHNNATLGIILQDEEKYIEAMPKKGRRLARLNQRTGFPAFNIGLSNIKEKSELIDLLMEMNVGFFLETGEEGQTADPDLEQASPQKETNG